jgi:hypothetical protein
MGMKLMTVATLALAAGVAQAAIFFEIESNDTLNTANDLGSYGVPGDGIVVDGMISSGDVDWFCFTLLDNATMVVAALFDLNPDQGNDGVMGLFDSLGNAIEIDDDDGIDLMPALQAADLAAGTYYIAISGYPDFDFEGDHEESFEYKLVIGLNIPTPGALALMGLGGLTIARRRR